jgi:hypothetical protein
VRHHGEIGRRRYHHLGASSAEPGDRRPPALDSIVGRHPVREVVRTNDDECHIRGPLTEVAHLARKARASSAGDGHSLGVDLHTALCEHAFQARCEAIVMTARTLAERNGVTEHRHSLDHPGPVSMCGRPSSGTDHDSSLSAIKHGEGSSGRIFAARRVSGPGDRVLDTMAITTLSLAIIDLTDGRGADGTVDAVGMEAHGSLLAKAAIGAVGVLPDVVAKPLSDKLAIDRTAALLSAIKSVRRGGTVSVSGVYGGEVDPMPLMEMFDRGITMRLGQCHVKRWTDATVQVLRQDADVLGVETLATHHPPLEEAPGAYEMFQKKQDGCIKVVLKP